MGIVEKDKLADPHVFFGVPNVRFSWGFAAGGKYRIGFALFNITPGAFPRQYFKFGGDAHLGEYVFGDVDINTNNFTVLDKFKGGKFFANNNKRASEALVAEEYEKERE